MFTVTVPVARLMIKKVWMRISSRHNPIPELPGCMSHGKSKKEAIENADKAADFWIKTAKEEGIKIPEPKGRLMFA